jgi:hypothetical protein
MNIEDVRQMANNNSDQARRNSARDIDEDDTLTEVGEDRDFGDLDDETDAADRRRDPLRMPH